MVHSSPQTFMWLGKPPIHQELLLPSVCPLSRLGSWSWLACFSLRLPGPGPSQLRTLRILPLMSLQAPVSPSTQTGVSLIYFPATQPTPPTCPTTVHLLQSTFTVFFCIIFALTWFRKCSYFLPLLLAVDLPKPQLSFPSKHILLFPDTMCVPLMESPYILTVTNLTSVLMLPVSFETPLP